MFATDLTTRWRHRPMWTVLRTRSGRVATASKVAADKPCTRVDTAVRVGPRGVTWAATRHEGRARMRNFHGHFETHLTLTTGDHASAAAWADAHAVKLT